MSIISTGGKVEISGIYKCLKCGNEITCVKNERVAPCASCRSGSQFTLVRKTN